MDLARYEVVPILDWLHRVSANLHVHHDAPHELCLEPACEASLAEPDPTEPTAELRETKT